MAVATEGMLSRFKGCMLGALIGNCLGAPYETNFDVGNSVVNNFLKKLADPKNEDPPIKYTGDTAMVKGVAQSLIDMKGFNPTDMARKHVDYYFAESWRGYGGNVINVFAALRDSKFKDILAPATTLFGGRGSYANGGGMRICPISLYTIQKTEEYASNMARDASLITHSNKTGYNGAILQCLAVRAALLTSASQLDPQKYVEDLISAMSRLHNPHVQDQKDCADVEGGNGYIDKLRVVQQLLVGKEVSPEEIIAKLGIGVCALNSIPTAIYAFLRGQTPIPGIESDSNFLRPIIYAISLGGDTDTIASMAGAITGAYLGSSEIPHFLERHCEGWNDAICQAQELHELVYPETKTGCS